MCHPAAKGAMHRMLTSYPLAVLRSRQAKASRHIWLDHLSKGMTCLEVEASNVHCLVT